MKKLFLLLALFINIVPFTLYAQSPKYFSFDGYNQVFDYRNDINLERIDTYRNINNKEYIERVVVTVINENEHQFYEYKYENGLLKTDISHVHDLSVDEYLYDEEKRLIKIGRNFEYKYISDVCREYYLKGKLQSREKVFEDDTLTKITRDNYSISLKTGEIVSAGKNEEEFFYDVNNNLLYFIGNRWNQKGTKSNFTKKVYFYYDEKNKLNKIVSGYNEDDIREIKLVNYDEYGHMSKLNVYDGNEKLQYEVNFSDYDNFENWHKSQTFYNDGTSETVIREFFYAQ